MNKKKILTVFFLIVIFLSACQAETPELTTSLVISEILSGMPGNNLHDFIELYNLGEEIVDLKGYSLWYQLKAEDEEILLYVWDQTTLVPPHGHYLLGQEGQEFDIRHPDGVSQAIFSFSRMVRAFQRGHDTFGFHCGYHRCTRAHPTVDGLCSACRIAGLLRPVRRVSSAYGRVAVRLEPPTRHRSRGDRISNDRGSARTAGRRW